MGVAQRASRHGLIPKTDVAFFVRAWQQQFECDRLPFYLVVGPIDSSDTPAAQLLADQIAPDLPARKGRDAGRIGSPAVDLL
jgi:hypothetical protein